MASASDPASEGLALPAPWEAHARTWMAWPCRAELWGEGLLAAQTAFAAVARAIARFEPVVMAARPQDGDEARLACGPAIEVWRVPLDDSWTRDIAPSFVVGPGAPATRLVAGVDWNFNAWGNKFHSYSEDEAFARRLLERQGMRRFPADLVLEGGSIAGDGAGTLLVTEECLLNANRNPALTRTDIEARLALFLGVRRVIWLPCGLEGDETDGHVDNVACFAGEGRVLLATAQDRRDANWERMAENRSVLARARDAEGRALDIVEVPLPRAGYGVHGQRLPFSYINFALANGGLILPQFDDRADADAARLLAEAFPGREIVPIDARVILQGGGGIHCITHEEPAGRAAPVQGGRP